MNWNRIGVLPSMLTVKFVVYTSVMHSVIPDPIFWVNIEMVIKTGGQTDERDLEVAVIRCIAAIWVIYRYTLD
jgi:hypothetical protein